MSSSVWLVLTFRRRILKSALQSMIKWENGSLVKLVHVSTKTVMIVLIEKVTTDHVSFGHIERPYDKLRVKQTGETSWGSGGGKQQSFCIQRLNDSSIRSFQAPERIYIQWAMYQKKQSSSGQDLGWYLGFVQNSDITDQASDFILRGDQSPSIFTAEILIRRTIYPSPLLKEKAPARILSRAELDQFIQQGYLIVRELIPVAEIEAARAFLNAKIGQPNMLIDGGVESGSLKLHGQVSHAREILALYSARCQNLTEQLLGQGRIQVPQSAQVALRFPECLSSSDPGPTDRHWHTDGMRQGRKRPFSCLLGIALSDQLVANQGNLQVFPQSHRSLYPLTQADGRIRGYDTVPCSRKSDAAWGNGHLPYVGPAHSLVMQRGDVVLVHPFLAHRGGPNTSSNIRYQVYFRLKHCDFETHTNSVEIDHLWTGFDVIQSHIQSTPPSIS